jgi:cytochrome b involved in lipid metabolism
MGEETNTGSKSNIFVFAILGTLLLGGVGLYIMTQQKPSPTTSSPTETSPAAEAKSYTLDEVAKHNSESDCWLAIEGKVYDVTEFVGRHPGGKAILNGCGKDATTLFNERPTNNKGPHPDQAKAQLPSFEIGTLAQ